MGTDPRITIPATDGWAVRRPSPLMRPVVNAIAAATTIPEVAHAAGVAREVVAGLLEKALDPLVVAGSMSETVDAMTRRLIDMAIVEMGDPPVAWAWLALGSAARREQAIRTDQDHALAYDPCGRPLDALDRYFLSLAEYVTSGLEAAGIPRCNADVVAVNRALRRPIEHWTEAFGTWMADPRSGTARQTTILFDHRRVAGSLKVERTLRQAISSSPERSAFVDRLQRLAREARPRRRLGRPRRIDLKHDGLMQIVTLARILAIEADIAEMGTVDRLREATSRGVLGTSSAERLADAFRVIWRIRLEHQITAAAAGEEPSELVSLRAPHVRKEIGEAFDSIRAAQSALLQVPKLRIPGALVITPNHHSDLRTATSKGRETRRRPIDASA